jgi:ABC-type antimicrobial peptide transport system permease subunit
MNLATARSQKRALEVGVRKALGGNRFNLVKQFMAESALITLIAMALAMFIVSVVLPFFNALIDGRLELSLGKFSHWTGLIGVGLLCCLLAGIYPAFYMSSFPSLEMMKRLKRKSISALLLRKGLVVFQFSVSTVLIICTSFIYLQIRHAKNRPLGMNIEQVLTVSASGDMMNKFEPLKQTLLNTGFVSDVALSGASMLHIQTGWTGMNWPGKPDNIDPRMLITMVSPGMISTLRLELLEGRDFDASMPAYGHFIINETLAKMMGDEGRVGGRLRQGTNNNYAEIIGVVKNFVFNDMYSVSQEPAAFWHNPNRTNRLFIRLNTSNVQSALSAIGAVIKEFSPANPFNYRFMEEQFNDIFHKELFTGKLAILFAALAIFISCLGLFGLTAFVAEQRTREIGIRKVFGASVSSVLLLLGRAFLFQLALSFAVAIPLGWFFVNNYWLNNFAYRIDTHWTVFAAVCLLVAFIAIFTVSIMALNAATANPVKSIKIHS